MGKFRATNVYVIASYATLGGMLFGFDISSISGVIGTPQYIKYFNNPTPTQQGGITAAMPGGSFCGALASGIIADRISRKYTIQLGAIIWCIGAILQSASQNMGMVCDTLLFPWLSSSVAYCWSIYCWNCGRSYEFHCPHLPIRTRSQERPWSHCLPSTMGDNMGHHDSILHSIRLQSYQWNSFVSFAMGYSNGPRRVSFHRASVLP